MGDLRSPENYRRSKNRDTGGGGKGGWIDEVVKDMRTLVSPDIVGTIGGRDADMWTNYKSVTIMVDWKYPFEVENTQNDKVYWGYRGFVCRGNCVILSGVKHQAKSPRDVIQLKIIMPYWETDWFSGTYQHFMDVIRYVIAVEDREGFHAYNKGHEYRKRNPRTITTAEMIARCKNL